MHLNDIRIFYYKKALHNYNIVRIKAVTKGNMKILLTIVRTGKLIQTSFLTFLKEKKISINLTPYTYTFWNILNHQSIFSKFFLNKLYKNIDYKIYIDDEESKIPLCIVSKNMIHKKFFYNILKKISYNKKFLNKNIYNILIKTLCTNNCNFFKIDKAILKNISIYNPILKINTLSSNSTIIWGIIQSCNRYKEHITLKDIKYFKKFSTISGNPIPDVFTTIISKEHLNRIYHYGSKHDFKRCITKHLTNISKVFNIRLKSISENINISIIIIINIHLKKILFFSFKITT